MSGIWRPRRHAWKSGKRIGGISGGSEESAKWMATSTRLRTSRQDVCWDTQLCFRASNWRQAAVQSRRFAVGCKNTSMVDIEIHVRTVHLRMKLPRFVLIRQPAQSLLDQYSQAGVCIRGSSQCRSRAGMQQSDGRIMGSEKAKMGYGAVSSTSYTESTTSSRLAEVIKRCHCMRL